MSNGSPSELVFHHGMFRGAHRYAGKRGPRIAKSPFRGHNLVPDRRFLDGSTGLAISIAGASKNNGHVAFLPRHSGCVQPVARPFISGETRTFQFVFDLASASNLHIGKKNRGVYAVDAGMVHPYFCASCARD